MQKLYVVVPTAGRTPEQVMEIREQVCSDVEEALMQDIELLLPTEGIEGVAAEVDAVSNANIVVIMDDAMYDKVCRVCGFVASEYVDYGVYGEDWVRSIVEQRRSERAGEATTDELIVE